MNDVSADTLACGTTIERLGAYLDHGRVPRDAAIETCPRCQHAMTFFAHVAVLGRDLIADDARRSPSPPEAWVERVMREVRSELRPGRSIPISHPDARARIAISEGAIRALLRTVGDAVDGVFLGRTSFAGDVERHGAQIAIDTSTSVRSGVLLPAVCDELRLTLAGALRTHTELHVSSIDITVAALHDTEPAAQRARPPAPHETRRFDDARASEAAAVPGVIDASVTNGAVAHSLAIQLHVDTTRPVPLTAREVADVMLARGDAGAVELRVTSITPAASLADM